MNPLQPKPLSAPMNWEAAVKAMAAGYYVRRQSEMGRTVIDPGDTGLMIDGDHCMAQAAHAPIYQSGEEGCYLAHAWTVNERPVQVFMGASSKCLFVPDDSHRAALDWVIVDKIDA